MTTFDRTALIRASEAARSLSEALCDLLDAECEPDHPVTVNPGADPEPPEGTVLAYKEQLSLRAGNAWKIFDGGRAVYWGDCGAADWTVLRWGWEGVPPSRRPLRSARLPPAGLTAQARVTTPKGVRAAHRASRWRRGKSLTPRR